MLTKIVKKLIGTRFGGGPECSISDKIIFSNKDCLSGFLDAFMGVVVIQNHRYIRKWGEDNLLLSQDRVIINKKSKYISLGPYPKKMLEDISQILNIFDIYSYIYREIWWKGKKSNNYSYYLTIRNNQTKKLANILNLKINQKQELLKIIKNHDFKYDLCKSENKIPNIINNKIIFESRNGRFKNIYFDKIKTIEEVINTTEFVYDLTVEDTRTFNIYNRLCLNDTFHFAGVGSKSKVTSSGVPRLKQILSNSQVKQASMTIYVNQRYVKYNSNVKSMLNQKKKIIDLKNNLEIIYFKDIIKSSQICTNFMNLDNEMIKNI